MKEKKKTAQKNPLCILNQGQKKKKLTPVAQFSLTKIDYLIHHSIVIIYKAQP